MKGLFYSVMMALFIVPILALIIFYSETGVQNVDINIRANELQYFSESVEKDLARFLEINGKRALISAVSEVIVNGIGLDNAQLRLAEMIENGTLYGNPAPLVDEKNLGNWKQNISDIASNLGFSIEFKDVEINIVQNDSFNVLFNTTIYINISDATAKMGVAKNITAPVYVSIEDIEDPIFPLKTYGRVFRFIKISKVNKKTIPSVTGQNSSGFVSGYAFVKSDFQSGDVNSSRILVTRNVNGKESIASGFAGVISEENVIIPPEILGKAITGATGATSLIKNETKIYLDATTKQVWDFSNLTSDIKNVNTNYYHYYHNSSKGASFLDRLEGRINLSDKYKYGLETFVDLEEFPTELVRSANSVLDYRYWNDTFGSSIRNGNYDNVFNWFKIDSESAYDYGINSLLS
jgi:hypothetical protein